MWIMVGLQYYLGNWLSWSLPLICEKNRGSVVQWSVVMRDPYCHVGPLIVDA